MVLEDWVRLVWIYYIKEKQYWFTLEDFAAWIWKNSRKTNTRISIHTIEKNLEKMVTKGYLKKVYSRWRNEWGLPVKRRRYIIIIPKVKQIALGK